MVKPYYVPEVASSYLCPLIQSSHNPAKEELLFFPVLDVEAKAQRTDDLVSRVAKPALEAGLQGPCMVCCISDRLWPVLLKAHCGVRLPSRGIALSFQSSREVSLPRIRGNDL